jgi:predicted CopG family antitoxin
MVTTNNTELKTLKISKEVHKELSELGGKGDSFDFIIRRLLTQKKDLDWALKTLSKEDREAVQNKIKAKWEDALE